MATDVSFDVNGYKYCNQDAVTLTEENRRIEIIETLDMEKEVSELKVFPLFSIKTVVLLAEIINSESNEQNIFQINEFGGRTNGDSSLFLL